MTLRQLRSMGQKWVERLRLKDWDITFRFATKEESETAWGWAVTDWHTKTAAILMVSPDDPGWGTDDHPRDFETILVHELLHCHMAPFGHEIGSTQHTIEETIVNQLARLLVALDRNDESVMNGGRRLSKIAAIKKIPSSVKKPTQKTLTNPADQVTVNSSPQPTQN